MFLILSGKMLEPIMRGICKYLWHNGNTDQYGAKKNSQHDG